MKKKVLQTNKGFSLIELLVTITVALILTFIAIPTFYDITTLSRTEAIQDEIIGALRFARYNAMINNRQIIVCRSSNNKTCDNTSDWNGEWIIFEDYDYSNSCNSPDGITCSDGGKILGVRGGFSNTIKVTKNNKIRNFIKFNPMGEAPGYPCTFSICSSNGEIAKGVTLSMIGRVRKRISNEAINCPK